MRGGVQRWFGQRVPAELEDILNHHPSIMDSCCVRSQDAKGEEILKAFVVLKRPNDPSAPTPDDIVAYVAVQEDPWSAVHRCHPEKRIRQIAAPQIAGDRSALASCRSCCMIVGKICVIRVLTAKA
ncbi:hypothetical protein PHYPSEUDO_002542 [Phytophthora pseudosyringae]|uniref:AMP-binding enzyme C-terminal domain-containing protein n=1 Tax=Phytophthora pseudosyringae TaxID=221518 RepID=A0A8T1VX69_9STRA|nr:hypothetical protein PHYPSEUDO_002542 [Phytophthora pseudosyringae]